MRLVEESNLLKPVFFSLLFLFLFPAPTLAAVINPLSYKITVSATVGEPRLNLFGYSSPNSLVRLSGQAVLEETIAGKSGYFFFDRVFLSFTPSELCLISFDSYSRASRPVCIPPLPQGPWEINVGPVILPPTISLTSNRFLPDQQVKAQGLTFPEADVTIYLANDFSSLSLIPPVFAYNLPEYRLRSDGNGYFEFNLPANNPSSWKMFAATQYQGRPGAPSNQLAFTVLNWWQWLLAIIAFYLSLIFSYLRPHLWFIVIILEVTLLIYLLRTQSARTVVREKR